MLSSVGLTKRERAVATLVSDGLSNKMIARKLGVAEGTVKVHVVNIFRKVGVRRRVELILEQNERLLRKELGQEAGGSV
jgi:two-component system, NarL family, nitrate/nitrite response regulator NarL